MTAPTRDALLLRYIRKLHVVDVFGWDCDECRGVYPCQTFRAANGQPGWPRDATEVLNELDKETA